MSELVKEKLKNALAFGYGKLVVETAKVYGKPAVAINKAIHGGPVGHDASKEDHIPNDDLLDDTFLMTFPTMEQSQRVSDALVNQTTALEQELIEALRGMIETFAPNEKAYNKRLFGQRQKIDKARQIIAKIEDEK